MPRGFENISSGSNLPARLLKIADRLRLDLKTAREREDNRICESNPLDNTAIRAAYLKAFKWDLSSPDIRAIVNFLRRQGTPIGSGSKGYWYCLAEDEWKTTDEHLTDRINGELAARTGVRDYFKKVKEAQMEIPL